MHLKRNIGAPEVPMAVASHTTYAPVSSSPPASSSPTIESPNASPPPPPPPPKSLKEKSSPFVNVSAEQSAKLAALEASGFTEYVFVKSPKVSIVRASFT